MPMQAHINRGLSRNTASTLKAWVLRWLSGPSICGLRQSRVSRYGGCATTSERSLASSWSLGVLELSGMKCVLPLGCHVQADSSGALETWSNDVSCGSTGLGEWAIVFNRFLSHVSHVRAF